MFVKEKTFYKNFFLLCIPLVLQNMISLGVNLADNIMLGKYAEASLSGVTAVNQIQFVYQNLLMGIGDGMVILASQYWGQKKIGEIKKISAVAMRMGLVMMALLFVVVSLFPTQMVGLFTTDPEIIAEGVAYIRVIRFTYPFFCLTTLLLATLRVTEVVRIALVLSVSTLCINCGINWLLIYGRFGLPRLGVTGAAVGTLTARIAEFILLLVFLKRKEMFLHLRVSDYLHLDRILLKDYFKVSLPIIFLQSLWGVNTAMQTAILGHLSSSAIAANSMASNLYLMVKTMAVGAASTTNVIIGKAIGEGDGKKVRRYANTMQLMFVCLGVTAGLCLLGLTEPVLSLYSFSPESRRLARSFLHILCVVMAFMCYQMPVNSGIIKGGGDTRYILKLDLISIWGIVIPLSFFVSFVLKASPEIVVICLNLDQIFKCVPAWIKVNYGHWMKKLTR